MKLSDTGKIEAIVYEEGVARGEWMELDLDLLAAIREGQLAVIKERCKNRDNCLEERLAEALNDIASKSPGFSWSVTDDRKRLYVYLPSDSKNAVRRFYSE